MSLDRQQGSTWQLAGAMCAPCSVSCAICHVPAAQLSVKVLAVVGASTCRELFAYQICLQQAVHTYVYIYTYICIYIEQGLSQLGHAQHVPGTRAAHDSNYINISICLLTCDSAVPWLPPTPPPTPPPIEVSDNLRLRSRSSLMSICAFCSQV